ncbi:MAG TPA: LytTR family DNA-binding domain-containing protein [Chitinophagaceae bacterium]|nr:LytTR family DNA-binding domain-containing protein [Chitinophagaceae bacterium]
MQIKCVITDDEPVARKGLLGYVEKIDFLQVVGVCENAIDLNSLLKQQQVDLIFLDIEMPYMSGIDLLKNLSSPPKIIFTTAYEKYAVKGFELDILDYLLKPISFERFLKAANKAHDYFLSASADKGGYIFIKTDNKLEKVIFSDIMFLEAMENYVAIHTKEKKLITHSTLKKMADSLPVGDFLQTHKSFIVNIRAVNSIEGNILNVGKHQVPVSKYQKDEVLQKILK